MLVMGGPRGMLFTDMEPAKSDIGCGLPPNPCVARQPGVQSVATNCESRLPAQAIEHPITPGGRYARPVRLV